ncbi:asparagine synthase (glutamine-hydrolyzing) [Micromonospora sp. WMMA1923]|uniref:asparagine synthase (glutamine-hydrolyzing) n=2 Tax=Micromonospora yangpuensis TaxID=683228 RepID=A0A1C6UAA3_9ACTN|nr:asparagine synthase (glutamine-hydrolyzing) [Micromonospora yangpuensis]GGL87945.1 asparagine synthetase B [Micromonospora yangpuensis]SCL50841.1 asparagine synthase (glutamine-hydrolysing) [Micromonospora yangpuensis]
MSGIAGWIDFRRDIGTRSSILRAMTGTMRDRGPDSAGVWMSAHAGLGYRGLDTGAPGGSGNLARVEFGDAAVTLVHAGPIYNLRELRRAVEAAGTRRRAESTPEILLETYLRHGERFVEQLDGMFTVAVWDGRHRRLLLARDRLGLKPLYYHRYADGVVFASEPTAVLTHPLVTARLELAALPIVLQPRLTRAGETPLVGLRELAPAELLGCTAEGTTSRRYWELTSAPHHDSFDKTAAHVRELLEESVGRQLATGVPGGAMLSGGVDSTSVAALAAQLLGGGGQRLDTYCVEFASDPSHFTPTELRPDVDAPYAAAAAEFLGTRHHTLTASVEDLLAAIPATRRARGLPGWGQFDASMYLIFQQMRERSVVALTGEAADEFLGGYPYFFKADRLERDTFPWIGDGPRLVDYLAPELRDVVRPAADERDRYHDLLGQVPRLPGEDPADARMREVFYLGMAGPLAVILDRKERMSMAHGLEVRVPFCDHRLVEYLWNVPWSMKSAGGVKGLLKAAMADLLPPGTVNRRKSAYPHVQSPRYDEALIREATWIVNDPASSLRAMFDTARLNGLIRQITAGRMDSELPGGASPAHLLIQLVELRAWIEENKVALP